MILRTLPLRLLFKNRPFAHFSTNLRESYVKGETMLRSIQCSTGEQLLKMAQKYPDRPALHSFDQNKTFTYKELTEKAVKLAIALRKQFQLQDEDRIGIYSLNNWEWYVVQLAAALANVILVNINPSYRIDQLKYTIDKVRLKVLFISDSFKNSDYLEILRQTFYQIKHPNSNPYMLHIPHFDYFRAVVRFNPQNTQNNKKKQRISGFVNFSDLLHQPFSLKSLPPFPSKHQIANIQFTSGTTGRPKAATLTHYNILNNGFTIGQKCGFSSQDNICVPVPLYHCFGMVMGNLAALTRGAALTYVCQGFDPRKALQAVTKYKCTALYGVPTMFIQYLRVFESAPEKYDIKSLRAGIIAGSLAPQALMRKIIDILNITDMTNCYGMTETSPVTFQTSPHDDMKQKTTTVGTILPGLQAKLVDHNGKTVPINTTGQLWAKGWAVMPGYFQDPVANEKSIEDGWMKSGDLAAMDEKGYLTIVGRNKDMIIRGGENIYPKQIQQFLNNKLKGILDVQVVGVSDQRYGEEVVAFVKVSDLENNHVSGNDVLRICKNHIAHYKVPKYLIFVKDYPLTVSGKVQKFMLRGQVEDMQKSGTLQKYAIR